MCVTSSFYDCTALTPTSAHQSEETLDCVWGIRKATFFYLQLILPLARVQTYFPYRTACAVIENYTNVRKMSSRNAPSRKRSPPSRNRRSPSPRRGSGRTPSAASSRRRHDDAQSRPPVNGRFVVYNYIVAYHDICINPIPPA